MSFQILADTDYAIAWESIYDWAFGPVFYSTNDEYAEDLCEQFYTWLQGKTATNPLKMTYADLREYYHQWMEIKVNGPREDLE